MKVIIIFPDEWLPYSPSILNIIKLLSEQQLESAIICFDIGNSIPSEFNCAATMRVVHLNIQLWNIARRLHFHKFLKIVLLSKALLGMQRKGAALIGVDSVGFLVARLFSRHAVFFSLEIFRDIWFKVGRLLGVEKVIIQSAERAQYLFGRSNSPEVYILPNSPILYDQTRQLVARRASETLTGARPLRFIYFGTIIPTHGVEACIRAVLNYDSNSQIYLQGFSPREYRAYLEITFHAYLNKRLFINSDYVCQNAVVEHLTQYDIGFVLYDLALIRSDDFNYRSSPSGKLYNYYAAGIPVIGIDIVGLQSVRECKAGILLSDITPNSLQTAIFELVRSYSEYRKNALIAGEIFEFRKAFNKIQALVLGRSVSRSQ